MPRKTKGGKRRKQRGSGIGSSAGEWLGQKAEDTIRGWLGFGRKMRMQGGSLPLSRVPPIVIN